VVAAALDDIAEQAQTAADTESVSISGDTMTGPLNLTSTLLSIGHSSGNNWMPYTDGNFYIRAPNTFFDNNVKFQDGSGSLELTGDTNSNYYMEATGEIRIRPNGTTTNKIVLNSSHITAPAYQVSGTTVIDSSRNLTNIGSISSSGNITRSSATTGTAYIRIDNTSAGTNNYAALQLDTDQNHTYKPGLLLNSSTNTNYGGANTLSLWQYHAYPISLVTNNTVRLTIGGSGGFDFKGNALSSVGTIGSSGQHSITGGSTGSILLKIGSATQTEYVDLQMVSNSGVAEFFKAGSTYTSWGGASAFNIYNSNGLIAFHPGGVANVLQVDTTGLNVGASRTIRMNGTTVIDASRNLTNIVSSTSTGLISNIRTSAFSPDGSSAGLRLEYSGGDVDGDIGSGIVFAQRWWSGSTSNVRTGGIAGFKNSGSGTFGGGLKFYTQPQGGSNMNLALTLDKDKNAQFAGTISSGGITANGSVNLGTTTDGSRRFKWYNDDNHTLYYDDNLLTTESADVFTYYQNVVFRHRDSTNAVIIGGSAGTISSGGITSAGDVEVKGGNELRVYRTDNATYGSIQYLTGAGGLKFRDVNGDGMTFSGASSDYAKIDTSGNFLVGKSSSSFNTVGVEIQPTRILATRSGGQALQVNRKGSDGAIISLHRDGTEIGSIQGRSGDLLIGTADVGLRFDDNAQAYIPFNVTTSAGRDAAIDLGHATVRYKDLYLSGKITADFSSARFFKYRSGSVADLEVLSDNNSNDVVRITGTGTADIFKVVDGSKNVFEVADGGTTTANGEFKVQSGSAYITHLNYQDNGQNYISQATSGGLTQFRNSNGMLMEIAASGNVTIANDLTVSGNFSVLGTTTTLNTATLDVEDKNITLNYGTGDTSGSANDAGITIQDAVNSTTDASIKWKTAGDYFDFSHGIFVNDTTGGSATADYSAYDKIRFSNSFADGPTRGPNKIVLYDDGAGWHGGFGISTGDFNYYSGGDHVFFKTGSSNSYTETFKIHDDGGLTVAGTLDGKKIKLTPSGHNSPPEHAALNIGFTSGLTRAIDIDGNWSANESKAITFTHGSSTANIIGQWEVRHNSPGSSMLWGKLYHSADSSTHTMELESESTTLSVLKINDDMVQIGQDSTYNGTYATLGFGGRTNGYNRIFGRVGTADGLFLASATGHGIYMRPNGGDATKLTVAAGGQVEIAQGDITLNQDGTYGGGYGTIGFGGTGNGSNRVFGSNSTGDGLYLAAATGRGVFFRVNGSGANSWQVNSSGALAAGPNAGTVVIDQSRNLVNLAGITTENSSSNFVDLTPTVNGEILHRFWNKSTGGSASAAMRIANSGNTNQGTRLEFSDQSYYVGTLSADRTNGMEFYVGNMTSPTQSVRMKITPTGRVRINAMNPNWDGLGTLLVKQVADDIGIGVVDDASSNTFQMRNNGTYAEMYYNVNLPIYFSQQGGTRLAIASSGNVGVGTGDAQAKFEVLTASSVQSQFSYNSTNYTQVNYDGTNTVGGDALFRRAGSEKLRLTATGATITGQLALTGLLNVVDIKAKDANGLNLQTDEGTKRVIVYDSGTVVINETGSNADFRVESDLDDHMLFVDASANAIGMGDPSPYSADWGTTTATRQVAIRGSNYGVLHIRGAHGGTET